MCFTILPRFATGFAIGLRLGCTLLNLDTGGMWRQILWTSSTSLETFILLLIAQLLFGQILIRLVGHRVMTAVMLTVRVLVISIFPSFWNMLDQSSQNILLMLTKHDQVTILRYEILFKRSRLGKSYFSSFAALAIM